MKTVKKITIAKALGTLLVAVCFPCNNFGQGLFYFSNRTAPTRLGYEDGPLAGPGTWAHMLVGELPGTLAPLGMSMEHNIFGVAVNSSATEVPYAPPGATVYVQMVAWDGDFWGTGLAGVPQDQLGRTDVVTVILGTGTSGPQTPQFTQAAVVPPIPEPSTYVLLCCGLGALFGLPGGRVGRGT